MNGPGLIKQISEPKCDLCKTYDFPFLITFCKSHPDQILLVGLGHKPGFDEEEKKLIRRMFPERNIRWEQRSIKDHAHCHIACKTGFPNL
jgi:hypothetical protein